MARTSAKGNLTRKSTAPARDPVPLLGPFTVHIHPNQIIFAQGEPCDAVFYLHTGTAKVHVLSKSGQDAVIMILGPGDFFGEGSLLDNAARAATVTTITECTIERIEVAEARRRLCTDPTFSKMFLDFLVTRNRRYLMDLSDLHFHSTEKRLARALLRLAKADTNGELQVAEPRLSQEMLADMIGTTRSRVNLLMNKFRRQGFIAYDRRGRLSVHHSLHQVFLEP
jgi:CRP/FNR family cyclic AMP-dependent transcriptional regulator